MREQSKNRKSKLWLLLWLLIFALAVAWRAQNLAAFGLVNDEGAYLMWSALAVEGHPLYSETQAVQPPLFFEWLGLAFRLAGQTVQVGRWAILPGFGLLAVALSWLAYRGGGWPSAVVTMVLLGLAPLIFTYSRLVMAEVPATGLAVTSLALVFVYLDRESKGWLLLSGLALGLSLIFKVLNPFVAAPIGLLLLLRSIRPDDRVWRWGAFLVDNLVWDAGVLIPLAMIWLFYNPAAMYDQLIRFRSDLRAAIPGSWSETWQHFAVFLGSHWGFWLLALGGIILAVFRLRPAANAVAKSQYRPNAAVALTQASSLQPIVWLVWLSAGIAMLAWHTPLFDQHFVVLLPPLILLGTGFISDVIALWQWRLGQWQDIKLATNPHLTAGPVIRFFRGVVVLSLVILVAVFNVPSMVSANQEMATIVTGGREAEALELLKAVSNPNDFVMGDSQLLIFMAERRTPPPLGDVALVAVKAGRQTSERMISLTETYQAPAVVQWSLRLPWLPDYLAWVEANYLARRVWDNDHTIYFVPRFSVDQAVPHEINVRLGEALILRGYQIDETSVAASRDLNLKVYWHTDAPLVEDYTIFTQLLDSEGVLVTGFDSQPLGGHFSTSQWPAEEIITDVVHLPLPSDLPVGHYSLVTGMYLLDTLERLQTPDRADHVVLETIAID